MFRVFVTWGLVLWLVAPVMRAAAADALDDAFKVCAALKNASTVITCDVHGWAQSVDVSLHVGPADAKPICDAIAHAVAQQSSRLAHGWKMRLFSPDSGQLTAQCAFNR
jgi:hypothetical protein